MNWFWIVVKNMHRGVILVPLYLTERVCYHVGEGLVSFSGNVEKLRKSLQAKLRSFKIKPDHERIKQVVN